MTSITVREYNPESGSLLGNISTLNYGKITAGTHSAVKVIDIAFNGVTEVSNIKIGLISSGGIVVNSNPTDILSDGTASNGYFGIESSSTFDNVRACQPLKRHFAGLNPTASPSSIYNVSINNRTATLSNYIYLDIELGNSDLGVGNGAYKIFFDYT